MEYCAVDFGVRSGFFFHWGYVALIQLQTWAACHYNYLVHLAAGEAVSQIAHCALHSWPIK